MALTNEQQQEIRQDAIRLCEQHGAVTPQMRASIASAEVVEEVPVEKRRVWMLKPIGKIKNKICNPAYSLVAAFAVVALVLSSDNHFYGNDLIAFLQPQNTQQEIAIISYMQPLLSRGEGFPLRPVTSDEEGRLIVINNPTTLVSVATGSQLYQGETFIPSSGLPPNDLNNLKGWFPIS